MKKGFLTVLMLLGIALSASAQHDDLYFVPKKKTAKTESEQKTDNKAAKEADSEKTLSVTAVSIKGLEMDEDLYNRRGSYLTEEGDAVSEFAMSDEGFVLITEEGDTMWMNTDTLRLARIEEGQGWINGFDGSEADYEYAMRIIRFRNPRHAIPVSSPLYWDIVYGGALWPSWDWNIYDDGLYAYVFPTTSNWHYWDYRINHWYGWRGIGYYGGPYWGGSFGISPWDPHWGPCYGAYWPGCSYWGGSHWFYGHYHGFDYMYYPMPGHPGHIGGGGGPLALRNDRRNDIASTRRGAQENGGVGRTSSVAASRQNSTTATRGASSATRSSSVRVVTSGSRTSTGSGSGASRTGRSISGEEVLRRGTSSSSAVSARGSSSSGTSRDTYSRQSTSRSSNSGVSSSYSRPSSTRNSSSAVSRNSSSYSNGSSSRGGSYSGSRSSGSSSSYSSSRSSSYSSSSSYSGGSSYSGSSSYSGGSSRSGGSYSGGSRSGGSSSGSRR